MGLFKKRNTWGIGLLLSSFCGVYLEAESARFSGNQHVDLYADFLYFKRNELNDRDLVRNLQGATEIHSKDLVHQFGYKPGYRVGVVFTPDFRYGFEGVFSYVYPWNAEIHKSLENSLSFPFKSPAYDADFTDADAATAKYESRYWDAELNFWRYFTDRRAQFFALGGLVGLRFFHWDEKFLLQMFQEDESSKYKINTSNRILAAQLGIDFQMHPTKLLNWELLAKGGCFANSTEQSQFLGDGGDTIVLRDSSASKWQSGFYADVLARLGFEVRKWLEFHVGYEALFFTGLALAPEQISDQVTSDAGKRIYTHGNATLYGLIAGAVLRF